MSSRVAAFDAFSHPENIAVILVSQTPDTSAREAVHVIYTVSYIPLTYMISMCKADRARLTDFANSDVANFVNP